MQPAAAAALDKSKAAHFDEDADIVMHVARMIKAHKLDQRQVGQQARVSQSILSQWLGRKYKFDNDRVDKAMGDWLEVLFSVAF